MDNLLALSENKMVLALFGALVGGILSPLILDYLKRRRRDRVWAKPRKDLLLKLLNNPKWTRRSLKWLTTVTGTTDEECRSRC